MATQQPGEYSGTLKVKLIEGKRLVAMDRNGKSDPYVKMDIGDKSVKSAIQYKTLDPVWNEDLEVEFENCDEATIHIKDDDRLGHNDPMGFVTLALSDLVDQEAHDVWLKVQPEKGLPPQLGELHVIAQFVSSKPLLAVFGIPLKVVMDLQKDSDLHIPKVQHLLSERVLALNGPTAEGIFRVPGDANDIKDIKAAINKGDYSVLDACSDVETVSGVLKLWFRDLPEPLIPEEQYAACLKCAEEGTPGAASAIVEELPEINRNIINALLAFLAIFAEEKNSEVSKMGVDNLAMVFAPSLLRSKDAAAMLADNQQTNKFVAMLLNDYIANH